MSLKPLDRRQFIQIIGTGTLLAGSVAACEQKPKAAEGKAAGQGKLPERPDDIALGPPNAPVQVVEYASMTCSHCAAFAVGNAEFKKPAVFPEIRTKYIGTGKVRYILRAFPLDAYALAASMAMRCAAGADPERYYAAADLVFRRQREWAFSSEDSNIIKNNLADLMKETGLGRAQFDACVANETELQRVKTVQNEAVDKYGVDSTPTFFINGTKYAGELEFKRFEEIVAPLLKGN
jgi:protein-disulfide isomerase